MSHPDALIVGCGTLGLRVALGLRERGYSVWASTRSAARARDLTALGLTPLVLDVTRPDTLAPLEVGAPLVVHCVGYDRRGTRGGPGRQEVYVGGLRHVLARLADRFDRLIYTSSTGLYGQTDGQWVDEDSATEPRTDSGSTVLAAESLLWSEHAGKSPLTLPVQGRSKPVNHRSETVVLRLAGLYGPERLLRREALERGEPIPGNPDHWLNLIHLDDAASAVLAVATAPSRLPHAIYNVVDTRPLPRREFYTHLARARHLPPPQFASGLPSSDSRDLSNKRVDGRRLRRDLPAFTLQFPDSRSFLATLSS